MAMTRGLPELSWRKDIWTGGVSARCCARFRCYRHGELVQRNDKAWSYSATTVFPPGAPMNAAATLTSPSGWQVTRTSKQRNSTTRGDEVSFSEIERVGI